MKRIKISILVVLTLALLVSANSQTAQSSTIKHVQVTAQTLASQPANTPYRIDLTRTGTIYEVAKGIDYSRVEVLTSKGSKTLSNLIKGTSSKRGSTSSKLLLGTGSDIIKRFKLNSGGTLQPSRGRVSALLDCPHPDLCVCEGLPGCIELLTSGRCEGTWICDSLIDGTLFCSCLTKR